MWTAAHVHDVGQPRTTFQFNMPCYTPLPMKRTVKTFIVWLLMLVLPLHAVAASVGMSCAPVPRHEGSAAGMAHHQAGPDPHAHHGGEHAVHAAHAAHDAGAAAEEHGAAPDTAKKTHASCIACSAACAGAVAPPSAFSPLPTFDGSEAVLVSPSPLVAGFIPDGPQRPPRQQSA